MIYIIFKNNNDYNFSYWIFKQNYSLKSLLKFDSVLWPL
jgi:hypothetical protein